ncbi:MAG: hypothetical protein ABSB58_07060 [Gemmatimonadales bacterium]|jgi:uncharacterized repeat protein (TIGR01451 family)
MRKLFTLLAVAVSLASAWAAGPARAQVAPPQPLVVTAENLTARAIGRANEVLPGDTVRYQLRFINSRSAAVRNVVFDNPVPNGMRYILGTAAADRQSTSVTYSIDGGKTYSAEPMVQRIVDGRRVNVPAPAELYSHIRWMVQGDLLPGARVSAEFRAQLATRPQDQPVPNRRGA